MSKKDGRTVEVKRRLKTAGGTYVVGTADKLYGSIFRKMDLPSGKVQIINKRVLDGALKKSDGIIRSNGTLKKA